MSFLNLSGVVDGTLPFVTNWLIQSALLIVVGLAVAATLRRRGAAVQSAVYRITLAAVLVAPVATWTWSGAGVTGWSLQPTLAVAPAPSSAQATHPVATAQVGERQTVPMGDAPAIAEREVAAGVPPVRDSRAQPAVARCPERSGVSP